MKKKLVLGVTSLVVASAVAIGGTLAYLTAPTQEMTNNFTAIGANVSGQLREKNWDGFDFNQQMWKTNQWGWSTLVDPDGTQANTPVGKLPDPGLGINKAKAITPNMEIKKDPTLLNTSKIPVYMAIKVTYDNKAYDAFHNKVAPNRISVDDAQYAPVASFAVNNGWLMADKTTYKKYVNDHTDIYFYVKDVNKDTGLNSVAVNDKTNALFDKIHINADIGYDALQNYTAGFWNTPGFGMKITGAAIQASDIQDATAKELLVKALTK